MRRHILAGFLMLWAGLATAQSPQVEAVITGQLDAFERGDFETAFSYASPLIQRQFGNADRFGVMVEQGYPMVIAPDRIRFLELREEAGRLWQKVLVVDAAGTAHMLDYQMIEVGSSWRINGVRFLMQDPIA
ncbi:DUF4864 domain-containing protein [Cognatishimia sp. SS12]|uniref:DUF4864 domain-containing protein n=1 Tax=Cognatishimia sp. SS12 TaxID=2979465 RepID=UPI00232FBA0A|nr:DUF4864 domain-containing protein [Cognatishimia sp. SS12]MDC0738878.1 DUF4864 domain-containing protein [Cognatishimia sp. SS12]